MCYLNWYKLNENWNEKATDYTWTYMEYSHTEQRKGLTWGTGEDTMTGIKSMLFTFTSNDWR